MKKFISLSFRQLFLAILMLAVFTPSLFAQDSYMDPENRKLQEVYAGGPFHEVKQLKSKVKTTIPKNVILLIGDGMGIAQLYAGVTANGGELYITNMPYTGFLTTYSSDNYVTDSAAGGTALATGQKTYNGAVGVNSEKEPIKNIRESAEEKGLSTGLVSTSAITHATPAAFVAHQPSRKMYEEIAADFLKANVDVFIGGGVDHFEKRVDGQNLSNQLRAKGYAVKYTMDEIVKVRKGRLAALTAPIHNEPMPERGDMLEPATKTAIRILKKNNNGFFLMVEGSQIDWGGHANKTPYVVQEVLDFDLAVGAAMKFAAKDGETLVIVTADHETGGMAILNGDFATGMVDGKYTDGGHTGLPVPVFAFGPGAEHFTGFMDNTDIPKKIKELMGL